MEEPSFQTPKPRQIFTQLKQAFNKTLILQNFDTERHIRIETDASSYVIGGVFSQMTLLMSQ